jgi:hypothetical protein
LEAEFAKIGKCDPNIGELDPESSAHENDILRSLRVFLSLGYKLDPDLEKDAAFMAGCLNICVQHEISANDMVLRVDSYRFTKNIKGGLSLKELDKLATQITEQMEEEKRKASRSVTSLGGIKVKPEKPSSLVRNSNTPAGAKPYDKNSLLAQLNNMKGTFSAAMDADDDLFAGDADVISNQKSLGLTPSQTVESKSSAEETATNSAQKKRRLNDGETEESKEDLASSEPTTIDSTGDAEMSGESSDKAENSAEKDAPASAAAAAAGRLLRPNFYMLPRVLPDGSRNESLFPKALGKYVTRTNAGEKVAALNDEMLARLEASSTQSLEEIQEEKKRQVEIEVFQPAEDLLAALHPEDEAAVSSAAVPEPQPKVNKYGPKNSKSLLSANGIDTTVFRYMYQNDDDLRSAVEENIQECKEIMWEKEGFKAMRAVVKAEPGATTLAQSVLPGNTAAAATGNAKVAPASPTTAVVKKEPGTTEDSEMKSSEPVVKKEPDSVALRMRRCLLLPQLPRKSRRRPKLLRLPRSRSATRTMRTALVRARATLFRWFPWPPRSRNPVSSSAGE